MAYFGNEPAKVAVKVGSGVITATELADDSITTADIIDDAITPNQLDDDGTGFQVGTLGVGAAVSGGHTLLVSGSSSFGNAFTSGYFQSSSTGIGFRASQQSYDTLYYSASNRIGFDGATTQRFQATNASFTGDLTIASELFITNRGSASTPAIRFGGDGSSGIFSGSSAEFGYAHGGSQKFLVNSSGNGEFAGTIKTKGTGNRTIALESTDNAQNLNIDYIDNAGNPYSRIRWREGECDWTFQSNVTSSSTDLVTISNTGNATFAGDVTTAKNYLISADSTDGNNNERVKLGASADLQLWHNATDSVVANFNTGKMYLWNYANGDTVLGSNDTIALTLSSANATFAGTITNTGLHTIKQTADDDGIKLTGYDDVNNRHGWIGITSIGYTQIFAEGDRSIDLKSGRQIRFFTSLDNSTYTNSVNFNSNGSVLISQATETPLHIKNTNTGAGQNCYLTIENDGGADTYLNFLQGSSNGYIKFTDEGDMIFQTAGMNDRLSIDSNGATFTGHLTIDGVHHPVLAIKGDSGGNDAHLQLLKENGHGWTIYNSGTTLYFRSDTSSNDQVLKLASDISATFYGGVFPAVDGTQDLGSDTQRWANVYTGDLHLKNDKGDWTIVEGEDELFVHNNLTGKKYTMMMKEVS